MLWTLLVVLIASAVSGQFASAGDVEVQEDGSIIVTLVDEGYDDSIILSCYDLYENSSKSTGEVFDVLTSVFRGVSLDEVFLYCMVTSVFGEGYFFPTDVEYVVNGINYDIGFSDYIPVEGSIGRMRGYASILLRLGGASAGDDVTLYLGDDSVTFTTYSIR